MKTWVKIREHYEICKETSEIKSCARVIRNTFSNNRRIPEKILKPQNGFVCIEGNTRKVADLYKKVFNTKNVSCETLKEGE